MGNLFGIPKPPKQRDPVVDVEEAADVAVPIDNDGGASVRKRMASARTRVGRGQLQIPKSGTSVGGVSIPK